MILKCLQVGCWQDGLPVAEEDRVEIVSSACVTHSHAVESSQTEATGGAAPVLAMSIDILVWDAREEILSAYTLWHMRDGLN